MIRETAHESMAELTMAELTARFGRNPLDQPLFYRNPHALRFQLDPGTARDADPTWRWAVVDRIRAVARWAFAQSRCIDVVVPSWFDAEQHPDHAAGPAPGHKRLVRAGFAAPFTVLAVDPPDEHSELSTCWHTACSGSPIADLDRLVWLTFVERRRRRRIGHPAYFVDIDAGLLLHPYDTRGMDLVAADAATLLPAYRRFSDWLLDYDRPAMDASMSAAAAGSDSDVAPSP